MNFVVFRTLEKLSAYQLETAFPKTCSLKKKNGHTKSLSMHFLSVLTDRVHQLQKGLRPFTGCVE